MGCHLERETKADCTPSGTTTISVCIIDQYAGHLYWEMEAAHVTNRNNLNSNSASLMVQAEKIFAKSIEEVLRIQKVDKEKGLDDPEIRTRREEFGRNELRESHQRSALVILLDQFKSVVILLLVFSAIVFCIGLLGATVKAPVLTQLLQTEPPSAKAWGLVLVASLIPFLVGQVVRVIQGHRSASL
jgi:magnesium-transporting ATPase (P-type)